LQIAIPQETKTAFDFLLLIVGEGGNSRRGAGSAGLPFPCLFHFGR
jgi:hypothetical protein